MEWIKYQLATLNQWTEYSPTAHKIMLLGAWVTFWVFICLHESGVL